jgi:hypothetical protein
MTHTAPAERICRDCAHFRNDPAYLEAQMPGWSSLGSAWGATRAEDGICVLRDLYLAATRSCDRFEALAPAASAT